MSESFFGFKEVSPLPKCQPKITKISALPSKGGFKSEDTGEFLHLKHKYSKSLS